jgi:hypothetical protein
MKRERNEKRMRNFGRRPQRYTARVSFRHILDVEIKMNLKERGNWLRIGVFSKHCGEPSRFIKIRNLLKNTHF